MRWLFRWLFRLVILTLGLIIILLLPVGYIELACIRKPSENTYIPLLPPEHRRAESRSLLTYPEWHIVHAYDDYAQVISTGDPHEFGYLQAITGFWSSLCDLTYVSADHGGFDGETKQTIYTIGVSFTAEMLVKAAYEETIGRAAVMMRGEMRAPLDDLSADQARAYAQFLQQVPWYKWNFAEDAEALNTNATDTPRDTERRIALGVEYGTKAAYAGVIAKAVEGIGADALSLRMVVTGATPDQLAAYDGITVIGPAKDGIEIATPRYRALTQLLDQMALDGLNFVEIAGNDDIMLSATAPGKRVNQALHSFERQGYGDYRHLILVKVSDLAGQLRAMQTGPLTLEHIHDY